MAPTGLQSFTLLVGIMKKTFIAASLALLSTVAAAADSGLFIGIDAGYSKFDTKSESVIGTVPAGIDVSIKEGGGAFGLTGGYRLNKNFALGVAYDKFADVKVTASAAGAGSATVSVKSDAFSLYGTATGWVTRETGLFAKLGVARGKSKIDDFGVNVSSSKTSALFGVGLTYSLGDALSLTGEYNHIQKFADSEGSMGVYKLGLRYGF